MGLSPDKAKKLKDNVREILQTDEGFLTDYPNLSDDEKMSLVFPDYSQIELRMIAKLTNDED